ncbi:MAG: OB-fold nucleic acid binding domain-containing protein, partial [Myxococcota bacterium]
ESRLRSGMNERGIIGESQEVIIRGIHSFALYGFPESHAASFALIAYASAFLKARHPAAFLAGLLNAYPMGFYSPATLVKDAQRHGVEVRPIDLAHSDWRCTLETPRHASRQPPLRLGLRYVDGLRKDTGLAIEAARANEKFASVSDLARRVTLRKGELDTLAELGALANIDTTAATRRSALWQVAALDRDRGSLFAGHPPVAADPSASGSSPLPEMTPIGATLADYRNSGLTTGPQIMAHLRPRLRERGILDANELKSIPNGRRARTAGQVIVRQRPRTAKGFMFLTLEDETGISNAILTPKTFRRFRVPLHTSTIIEIEGPLQNVEGVIHVRVHDLVPLIGRENLPASHDYH